MFEDAITVIFDGLKKAAGDEANGVNVVFGVREPRKQINQGQGRASRVCILPGDDSGKLGTYAQPRQTTKNGRNVVQMFAFARVYIWAADTAAAAMRDEQAQYRAVRQLHEWVVAKIHTLARGTYEIKGARRVEDETDVPVFGSEMVLDLTIQIPIFDEPLTNVTAAGAQGQAGMQLPGGETIACG